MRHHARVAGPARTRRTGRLLLAIAVLLLVVVVIVWRSWPAPRSSDEHTVLGPDSPSFRSATQLLAAARNGGVSCGDRRRFDPLGHVARDSVPFSVPDSLSCVLSDGTRVYVLVYRRREDRMKAFDTGDVNGTLCALPSSRGRTALPAIVAANWRIATPRPAANLAPLVRAFDGLPASETISCVFRM
jgi:hypothetical protein